MKNSQKKSNDLEQCEVFAQITKEETRTETRPYIFRPLPWDSTTHNLPDSSAIESAKKAIHKIALYSMFT